MSKTNRECEFHPISFSVVIHLEYKNHTTSYSNASQLTMCIQITCGSDYNANLHWQILGEPNILHFNKVPGNVMMLDLVVPYR